MGQLDPTGGGGGLSSAAGVSAGGIFGSAGAGAAGVAGGAEHSRDRRRGDRAGAVGDRDPAERRAGAARFVRHEAGGAGGDSGRVQADRYGGAGHPDVRAFAAAGGASAGSWRSFARCPIPRGTTCTAVHRVLTGQVSNPRGATRPRSGCLARRLSRVMRRLSTSSGGGGMGFPTAWRCRSRLVEGPLTWPGPGRGVSGAAARPVAASARSGASRGTRRQPGVAGGTRSGAAASRGGTS